jgi:hypothetical protein
MSNLMKAIVKLLRDANYTDKEIAEELHRVASEVGKGGMWL